MPWSNPPKIATKSISLSLKLTYLVKKLVRLTKIGNNIDPKILSLVFSLPKNA